MWPNYQQLLLVPKPSSPSSPFSPSRYTVQTPPLPLTLSIYSVDLTPSILTQFSVFSFPRSTETFKLSSVYILTKAEAMASVKFACVVLMCLAVMSVPIAQAITCGQVTSSLAPCLGYLRGGAFYPPCCNGVRSLVSLAQNTADRRLACNCLKQSAGSIPGLKPAYAAGLPGKCGVNIPYKISTSTNCNTIQ